MEERLNLLMDMKKKGIKMRELAEICNCSSAWITNYFSIKKQVSISSEHEKLIKEYVASK